MVEKYTQIILEEKGFFVVFALLTVNNDTCVIWFLQILHCWTFVFKIEQTTQPKDKSLAGFVEIMTLVI